MKQTNLLTIMLSLAMACTLNAQTNKGAVMFGLHNFSSFAPEAGNLLAPTSALGIAFGTYTSDYGDTEDKLKYVTIGLSASAHYFLVDNFSAGLLLNLSSQKITEDGGNDGEYKTNIIMAGPELRYYIPVSTKAKVWISGAGTFGTAKVTFSDEEEADDPTKLARFGGGAGVAFFPNQHFSIDLGLGYNVFTAKNTDTLYGDSKDTNSGLTFDIGFSVFLGK
jgi:hypothetical protein